MIPLFAAITTLHFLQSPRAVWHNWMVTAASVPGTNDSLPLAKKHTLRGDNESLFYMG